MREYYDEYGDKEWERLDGSVAGRVSFELHRRFLERYVTAGMRVLEVGAGPGRFTLALADRGASVVVTDFSRVQLDLNERRVSATSAERAVEGREILDVCDTSRYADGSFDAVVAFGGPLSYAFDDIDTALGGLFRITRPGGVVLASVMSSLGTWRSFLPAVVELAGHIGEDANDAVLRTGDLRIIDAGHQCQMFRAREVGDLVTRCRGKLLAISASNWASLADPTVLAAVEDDPERWRHFLDNEADACAEPGALDGGTHIIFACTHGPDS
jgi:SAM-dependent methyltransferase